MKHVAASTAGTRSAGVAVAVAMVTVAGLVSGCRGEEHVGQQRTVTFFYEVICGSCEEPPELARIKTDVFALNRDFDHITATAHDVFTTAGLEALKETAGRLGMDPVSIRAPALVVDEEVYLGEDAIIAELDRLLGRQAASDRSIDPP